MKHVTLKVADRDFWTTTTFSRINRTRQHGECETLSEATYTKTCLFKKVPTARPDGSRLIEDRCDIADRTGSAARGMTLAN